MNDQEAHYIALEDAATELGVARGTLYYYMRQLNIETKKFPLDKRAYISTPDLAQIKKFKRAAEERRH